KRGSCERPAFMARSAWRSPISCNRSAGKLPASRPPPLPAATAIASSSSAPPVTERLAIARLGALGDGICDTPAGPLYVPYALPGETVAVQQWPGHGSRRHLIEVEIASPERIAPICPHFG